MVHADNIVVEMSCQKKIFSHNFFSFFFVFLYNLNLAVTND